MTIRLSFSNAHVGQRVTLPYCVDHILTLGDLPEDGVLPIQVGRRHMGNEELASIGPWSGIGHRKGPDLVLVGVAFELVREAVPRSSPAAAFWISALNHEVGDDPMKGGPIVELIPGQEDEVVHRQGRLLGK